MLHLFLLIVVVGIISGQNNQPEINTPFGKIIGKLVYFYNIPVNTFQSIPYAKPPTGELRFKKPQPIEPWREPLLAHKLPPGCVQYSANPSQWYDDLPGKTQDCLYLNIWTPHTAGLEEKKTVMFWIHGGAFRIGSSRLDYYDGTVLTALGDVVVVTMNYRLTAEGFLYSGTDDAPGNMGLLDILEALKWVKCNIKFFGGDENNITLFGQSAGAITIGMFMTSPLARGLFVRAILQSGSPANLDAEDNSKDFNLSQKISEAVGCASDGNSLKNNPKEILRCLRDKDALELARIELNVSDNPQRGLYPRYGDDILPFNAREALIKGKFENIDILIGNNHDEGSLLITKAMRDTFGLFGEKNPKINKTFGEQIIRNNFKSFADTDAVVNHYLGNLNEDDYDKILYQVHTASGDYARVCPSVYMAESVAKKENTVLYYYFVHRTSSAPWAPWVGVPHSDEIQYVFGFPLRYPSNYTESEQLLSLQMIKVWTSFAKSGPKDLLKSWPQYTRQHHYYFTFGNSLKYEGTGPHLRNCEFFRPYFGF
ncbi:acetylcholinesterase-1-like isoform X1 [Argiope bruennichi]|uniref:acetylcholinesterase-1-like isoform X1 n=2 Tax=Argiope bruennichi TaxID=94029 RepID=UPI00249472AC|nr:acetylcholinesterase-1-like isoform X1 [Argiope bruennichi]XP_055926473.1 acetylcholinesterase-1-like isoform X1 [Argiope bruennichi]